MRATYFTGNERAELDALFAAALAACGLSMDDLTVSTDGSSLVATVDAFKIKPSQGTSRRLHACIAPCARSATAVAAVGALGAFLDCAEGVMPAEASAALGEVRSRAVRAAAYGGVVDAMSGPSMTALWARHFRPTQEIKFLDLTNPNVVAWLRQVERALPLGSLDRIGRDLQLRRALKKPRMSVVMAQELLRRANAVADSNRRTAICATWMLALGSASTTRQILRSAISKRVKTPGSIETTMKTLADPAAFRVLREQALQARLEGTPAAAGRRGPGPASAQIA